jgi:hypothetical protein
MIALVTPLVLRRIRELCEGPMVVLKGPSVAARYPNGARAFNDLDVLVTDAGRLHARLLDHGFVPLEDPDMEELDISYHLQPLAWGQYPVRVEIHSRPNWPLGLKQPPVAEIFDQAVPAEGLGAGISSPAPLHAALLLAGHGFTERRLGALRDLIDVAVMAEGIPPGDLASTAEAWGMARLWRTTWAAVEAVLLERRRSPLAVSLWARHLVSARERTVLENHLERWLSPFWALPTRHAIPMSLRAIQAELIPLKRYVERSRRGPNTSGSSASSRHRSSTAVMDWVSGETETKSEDTAG